MLSVATVTLGASVGKHTVISGVKMIGKLLLLNPVVESTFTQVLYFEVNCILLEYFTFSVTLLLRHYI